ncbi:MAG TPA: hypothetical protein VIK30_06590 [Polyangia bacterium]
MLGLVLSLVVSAAPAMPSASVTCPDWPASCDGAAVEIATGAQGNDDASDDTGPRDYATPAEIDCPTPGDGPIASGECDEAPLDLWYRVSRSPDSEQPNGAIAPPAHRARAGRGVSCGSGPADPAHLAPPDVQPVALFALPGLVPASVRGRFLAGTQPLPLRTLTPPDRPPRA